MNLADFVGEAGVEEDALRGGGFTGIDVGHDAEVARKSEMFVYFSHFGFNGILRSMRDWENERDSGESGSAESEAEVGEGAVCLGHLVHVFLALEGTALVVESVHDLGGELVAHGLATALAGVVDKVFH